MPGQKQVSAHIVYLEAEAAKSNASASATLPPRASAPAGYTQAGPNVDVCADASRWLIVHVQGNGWKHGGHNGPNKVDEPDGPESILFVAAGQSFKWDPKGHALKGLIVQTTIKNLPAYTYSFTQFQNQPPNLSGERVIKAWVCA